MLSEKRKAGVRPSAALLLLLICLLLGCTWTVRAEEKKKCEKCDNYETWLQTVYSRENGLSVGTANAIATTSDGILWIGTYAGLYRYNGSRFELMNQYETVKSVECLYVDEDDRLWVGTNDRGISIFQNEQMVGTVTMEDGLPSDAVRSIVRGTDGLYYIGTSDTMAVVRFGETIEVSGTIEDIEYADKSTSDQNGNTVAVSSYGTMYLLREGAIVSESNLAEPDRFTSCAFDASGKLYAGSSLGNVYIYEITEEGFQEVTTVACSGIRKINNLIRINAYTIFVCADNGIGYFHDDGKFSILETPTFHSNIYDVIVDYQGNLWFASSRMGLLRLCKTSFIDLFTQYSIDRR